jgi:spore coat protein U-like protein
VTLPRALLVMLVALGVVRGMAIDGATIEQYPRGMLAAPLFGCTIETRQVSFGNYNPLNGPSVYARGSVIYACGLKVVTPIRNIRVEISQGRAGSFNRAMFSGQERLNYNLYLDSTHDTVWGDGSGGTNYYFDASPPFQRPVEVPIHGRVLAQQDVPAGSYSDNLQVRILF